MNTMDDKHVIKTIKKVMPAVVSIVISERLEDLEKELPKEFYAGVPGGAAPAMNAGDSVNGAAGKGGTAKKSRIPASMHRLQLAREVRIY